MDKKQSKINCSVQFKPEGDTLTATLYLNGGALDTYEYSNWCDSEDETNECYQDFISALESEDVFLSPSDAIKLKESIKRKFEDFEETEDDDDDNDDIITRRFFDRAEVLNSIKNNECSFAQYCIDVCMDRIRQGYKKLNPGEAGVPKNINFVTNWGERYYAKIGSIEIFNGTKVKEFGAAFDDSGSIIVVAFESADKSTVLALGLNYIGAATEDRNIRFYTSAKKISFSYGDISFVIFPLSECSIEVLSNSRLSPNLSPALNYYCKQLELIQQKSDNVQIKVNLKLYRDYYDEFKSLVVDDDLLIIPVYGKPQRLKSMSLRVEDFNGKHPKYDFYEGTLNPLSREDEEIYIDALAQQGVVLPNNTQLALLDLIELSEKDVYLYRRILTDVNTSSCTIVNNIEGDKVRLKRIITGIENALTGKVSNKHLVETICKNDIYVSCDPTNASYARNEKYIEELKLLYPVLAANEEQLVAIDKIIQMNSHDIDLMLIQGPPGTGKTELILALAKELSKAEFNTLITSNVHVACDNIVDRLKNNKDLVLKRYTTIYGEQYEKEIIENKKKYVENQVFEGFRCKDIDIVSRESYDKVLGIVANYEENKQQIYSTKEKYDADIRTYNDLLSEKQFLENKKSELLVEIDSTEKRTSDLIVEKDSVSELIDNLKAEKDKKQSLLDSIQEDVKSCSSIYEQKASDLNALYSSISEKEETIEKNKNQIVTLNNAINEIIETNEYLKGSLAFYEGLSLKNIKKEVVDNYCKRKSFSNERYSKLLESVLDDIVFLSDIYSRLQSDSIFVSEGTMSAQTIEYLYYHNQKNPLLKEFLDENILEMLKDVYQFNSVTGIKKGMMSVLPFIKVDGHPRSYFNNCITLINREFKKIQFYFSDFISTILQKVIDDKSLCEKRDEISNNLKENNKTLEAYHLIISELNASIERDTETIDDLKKDISKQSKELLNEKTKVNKLKSQEEDILSDVNHLLAELQTQTERLSVLHHEYDQLCQKKNQLNDELTTNGEEIKNNEIAIDAEYDGKHELIDNYEIFMNNFDIDIKNINKEISIYQIVIDRINSKIDLLMANGWERDTAFELLFSYATELKKISECDASKIDRYIHGRGNEFNQMFLLSDKSDGSLISMTTNQIASFFTSADNRDITFDYAIIDEASKCRFEDLIISLPKVKHLVLIGDFMQLDPMYEQYDKIDLIYQNMFSHEKWDALNRSSFSLLLSQFLDYNAQNGLNSFDANPFVAVMKRQYRMNKGIFKIIEPIYAIHEGFELIDEKQSTANDVKCINISGNEIINAGSTSSYNIEEGNAIISFLKNFEKCKDNYPQIKSIGVITGYRAQENYLRRNLKAVRLPKLQIGTFDRFQGREFDLVIVSLVRTQRLGFTNNIRRMNVAFSRAKNHLLIFGNMDSLNKIAMKGMSSTDEYSNINAKENSFVVKKMIPYLFTIREDFVSDKERVESIMNFLKENDYE